MRRRERRDWLDATEAGPSARLVFLVLTLYENDQTGWAYPSRAKLAVKTGLNRNTVFNALRELVELGELEMDVRPGRSTGYRIVHNPSSHTTGRGVVSHDTPVVSHDTRVVSDDTEVIVLSEGIKKGVSAASPPQRATALTDHRGRTFLPGTGWLQ